MAVIAGLFDSEADATKAMDRLMQEKAVREGSTLALVKASDQDANRIRLLFRSFGARTYRKE